MDGDGRRVKKKGKPGAAPILTLGKVRGWAISRLHLSPAEFYMMRPGEFWEAMIAWREDNEADRRHVAEVIRGVGVRLFNIQLKPKNQISDIRKFLPLPWDEEDCSGEEVERLNSMSVEDKFAAAHSFLERINWRK